MTAYFAIVMRDVRLVFGRGTEGLATIFFFLIVASLFPVAFAHDPDLIRAAGVAVLWVAALLASLLAMEGIYHRDYDDGTFDLLLLSPLSPAGIMAAKMVAHFIVTGSVLTILSVPLAYMLLQPADTVPVLLASLALGTGYLSLLGGVGAALTFGSRRPGLLLVVIVLPLSLPAMLAGMAAVGAQLAGNTAQTGLLLQLALLVACLPVLPYVAGRLLRGAVAS